MNTLGFFQTDLAYRREVVTLDVLPSPASSQSRLHCKTWFLNKYLYTLIEGDQGRRADVDVDVTLKKFHRMLSGSGHLQARANGSPSRQLSSVLQAPRLGISTLRLMTFMLLVSCTRFCGVCWFVMEVDIFNIFTFGSGHFLL
jgi:hypothetical protein